MNNADVAWMLVSTALVLLMTPALAFFYGGLVLSKNALNTMMMSFISLGFAGVAWALLGYSLAFAPGTSLIGGLSFGLLKGVTLDPQGTIPHVLFMAFQGTFAVITAALISGAIVERNAGGALIHYNWVGYLAVLATLIAIFWINEVRSLDAVPGKPVALDG
jgi:Amt family ammonium transporter